MRTLIAIGALALVGACATSASPRIDKQAAATLAKYEPTGETDRCLPVSRISKMTAVDENTMLVRTGTNQYYVNKVRGRCTNATGISHRLQYTVSTGQLCAIDIIQVVDNMSGMMVGSCSLGEFEKLALKQEPEETE